MDLEQLNKVYQKYFSLEYFGKDINNKFAIISLVSYITYKRSKKHPTWSNYDTLKVLGKGIISEDIINRLAVICEDFSYGCDNFITFGLTDKEIPNKVKELLSNHLPF